MIKATVDRHGLCKHPFPGVTKGCVAQVMGERDTLRQVLIQTQLPGNGSRNLGTFKRVREAISVVIAFEVYEYLGFVLQSAERGCVHDPIPIALKRRPVRVGLFVIETTP
jgi:hypothetical protein